MKHDYSADCCTWCFVLCSWVHPWEKYMKGVYIEDMYIPTGCATCKLFGEYGCPLIGTITYALTRGKRHKDCPLVSASDMRPVVHGRWIEFETDWPPRRNRCSECGYTTNPWLAHVYNFCPNCGADMREPSKEE